MATIQASKTEKPTTINKFLGLNLSDTGDTQIALGESGNMTNFYITDDYKLRKMYGYRLFHQFTDAIKGIFSAKISNTRYLFVASGGHLWSFTESQLIDSEVNPEKSDFFTADGTETEFTTSHNNIYMIDRIKVGKSRTFYNEMTVSGSTVTFPSKTVDEVTYPGGTINLTTGKITFDTAPEEDTKILITYLRYVQATDLGAFTDEDGNVVDENVSFFEFDDKVYILGGGYYVVKDPTSQTQADRLSRVEGYIPKVFINTPPAGGGTIYEEINMLTGKKHQTFNPDGTATYQLAQKGIASVDKVIVDGVEKVVNTDYTANTTNGTVTFNNDKIPASTLGMDTVDIYWTKTDTGNRDIIEGMKYGTIFGGDVDTRVFVYGNDSFQNRAYYSAISFENDIAVPSVEYFPATAQVDIGPANFALTDLTRQYDRLLATTNKPEAYYLTISTEQLPVTLSDSSTTTRYVPAVTTLPLNEAHGNVAMGQGQLLMNYPATFEDGAIVMWKATNVRDEKNAEIISEKIKLDLDKINLANIKTLDYQEDNQLWITSSDASKTRIWIYNYENKTYSRLELPDVMTGITSMGGNIYMTTGDKGIVKFSKSFITYGNDPTPDIKYDPTQETQKKAIEEKIKITAYWEMNFSDFGVPYLRKTMSKLWISLQPQNWTSCVVSFISNRLESTINKRVEYKKQWFDDVNFGDFHFTSSINPQPFRLKLKAKKFTNMKITIKNDENSTCTVLSLALQVESFGYSK